MSFLASNKELNKVLINISQTKHLALQEHQRFDLDLDKARWEIASLNKKLCYARRNLEDEKRKRRSIESYGNLLENHIDTARQILFNDGEINLDERTKEKLQFLNRFMVEMKRNNASVKNKQNQGQLTAITGSDSTGSILSDLNCLSKSEDDLYAGAVMRTRGQMEHRQECRRGDERPADKQRNTLDRVAEFNSPDRATAARVAASRSDTCITITTTTTITAAATAFKNPVVGEDGADRRPAATATPASHNFVSKIIIRPETCGLCDKRIRFGRTALRCRGCHITCHTECRIKILSFPCTRRKFCNAAK